MPVLVSLFEGQLCQRCKQPIGRHQFTGLGAIRCYELPGNSGLTPWYSHKFVTLDGQPYLSILEQVGMLAGMLEERGLPEAYESAMENIRHLVSRLAGCAPGDVLPCKDWFKPEPRKEQPCEEVAQ